MAEEKTHPSSQQKKSSIDGFVSSPKKTSKPEAYRNRLHDNSFQPRLVRPAPFASPEPVKHSQVQPAQPKRQSEHNPEPQPARPQKQEPAVPEIPPELQIKDRVERQVPTEEATKQAKEYIAVPQSRQFSPSFAVASLVLLVGLVSGGLFMTRQAEAPQVLDASISGNVHTGGLREPASTPVSIEEAPITDKEFAEYSVAQVDPRYIRISTIDVNARVLSVGIDNNAVGTPVNINDTAWFTEGTEISGNTSGAVLMVGNIAGPTQSGVFSRLSELSPGDIVEIELGSGEVRRFEVTDSQTYEPSKVDMARALEPARNSQLGLNLLTSGPIYDTETKTIRDRVLVRTVEIP